MTLLEDRLHVALHAGAAAVPDSPDLFARVERSIEADRARRRALRRIVAGAGAAIVATGASVVTWINTSEGEVRMDWWVLELITTGVLIALALWLGPFIKRFGKSYAADVFRSNPGTGKSFIVLTDFAYYLIFGAYILFTMRIKAPNNWPNTVSAGQVQESIARLGGIILIIGLLHSANLLLLPVIGRLLTLNRRLDMAMGEIAARQQSEREAGQDDAGWRDRDSEL